MITVTVTAVLMTIFLIVFSLATGVSSTFLLFWAHGGGWHPLRMARDIDDLRAVQADPVMIGYAPTLAVVFVLIVVWCVVLATFQHHHAHEQACRRVPPGPRHHRLLPRCPVNVTYRPLSDRSWIRPAGRSSTRFRATWTDTLRLLKQEAEYLGATELVIGLDVAEMDLTLSGQPVLMRCDEYTTAYYDQGAAWKHNVRAIAMTLEALRAVDRYGASRSGEQYRGYVQITSEPEVMSHTTAVIVVVDLAGAEMGPQVEDELPVLWKLARRNAHPDLHRGDRASWDQLEAAGKVLNLL